MTTRLRIITEEADSIIAAATPVRRERLPFLEMAPSVSRRER